MLHTTPFKWKLQQSVLILPIEIKQFESYLPVATVAYNFEDFLVSRPP